MPGPESKDAWDECAADVPTVPRHLDSFGQLATYLVFFERGEPPKLQRPRMAGSYLLLGAKQITH